MIVTKKVLSIIIGENESSKYWLSVLNSLKKHRSVFHSSQTLMKALYLRTFEIIKKCTIPISNLGKIRGELETLFPELISI